MRKDGDPCYVCSTSGRCISCGGSGKQGKDTCGACNGSGRCSGCGGSGWR